MKPVLPNILRVAGFSDNSGARQWRLEDPFTYLNRAGFEAQMIQGPIEEGVLQWADIYVLHGIVDRRGIALMRAYQEQHGKKIVIDMDDHPVVDDDNPYKRDHDITGAPEIMKETMGIADAVTTTTPYLAKLLREFSDKVHVLPNCLDLERWDLPKQKNTQGRVRIGWAGSVTHVRDIEMVVEALERIKRDYPQVDIILVGDPRLRSLFSVPVEAMLGVPFDAWPARLHGLRLDIGIAPLLDTTFNRCKSNIKFLEYAIAQIPGVYSPTIYDFAGFDGVYGLVAKTSQQWYGCIRNLITSKELRGDITEHAYSYVRGKYSLAKETRARAELYRSL